MKKPTVRKPSVRKPTVKLPKVKAPTVKGKPLIKITKKPAARKQPARDRSEAEVRELVIARERLQERFTIMQADLGGAFYEMAIRDHVKLDVLTRKAAELQRVDVELGEIEEHLKLLHADLGLACPSCGADVDGGDAFCSSCGADLAAKANGTGETRKEGAK